MSDRFFVLRADGDGLLFLDRAGAWTAYKDQARRFDCRAEAEIARAAVVPVGVAAGVVAEVE